ncbi:alkaline phosphatase family protein [Kitasatospora viridis]|uniref:Putative Ig domain-containing protein n=1 Tax=Kitasatospora viridis TaxID=281105 RepID=A0A561S9L3_9ACTN|nr:alkaline phosphatase family protein [Kitasatospora viridis]TWF71550.1 putative Ig domain-containing protein [Kitasatospora viridis]
MRVPRLAGAAAVLGLLCGLSTSVAAATPASAAGPALPRPDHVVVVMFENTSESSILGNSQAPYFNQLANTGANFTDSSAIEHPSQPNYLDLFSGSDEGVTDDSCPQTFSTDNEAAELAAKGLSFTGYAEDLPTDLSTCTSGEYARKHVPWVNFTNVPASDSKPFSAFPTDYSQLPTVSWVIPNLCDDIHDCSIATGDTWLKNNLDGYVQWAKTHNSLLITTFDENDGTAGNQIATFFDGQPVKPGNYGEAIDHFSVLRTIEDMYGLSYAGAAAQATPITDVWNGGGTTGSVSVTAPGNQTGTVGAAASLQLRASDTAGGTLGWSASGLPAGLSISQSGLITGTPTAAGTSSVTVTATDSTGPSSTATFSWTVNPAGGGGCTPAQLLGNPGFETGSAAPWSSTSGVVNGDLNSEPAHSGNYDAWLDGYGSAHTDTLAQTVTIPANCTASLSFWLHIDTQQTDGTAHDTLTLQAGSTTLRTWSNLDANTGYAQQTLDLSAYAGQSVTLTFTGTQDGAAQTSFVIDDTALNIS